MLQWNFSHSTTSGRAAASSSQSGVSKSSKVRQTAAVAG